MHRFSTVINVPCFSDAKKYKIGDKTLNPYQKPLLIFMRHLLMFTESNADSGSIIIDLTSGSGTTAVSNTLLEAPIICLN